MSKRAGLLAAVAVLVAAVVISLVIWRGGGSSSPKSLPVGVAEEFDFDQEALVSPEIEVAVITIRGTVLPGYTDWMCLLECREPDGCNADIQITVDYRSSGERRVLQLAGRLQAEMGETMRIGRPQRPPTAVDGIDAVTVKVLRSYREGAPEPTEME